MPTHEGIRGVFTHIPKTGGTSTSQMFGRWVYGSGHDTCELSRCKFIAEGGAADHWASLFKFAVVRNPWARLLSRYLSMNRSRILDASVGGFREWIATTAREPVTRNECPDHMFEGVDLDYVGRFEDFRVNLAAIAAGLGVPLPGECHLNNRSRLLEQRIAGQPEVELRSQFRLIVRELVPWREHFATRYIAGDWRPYYDATTHDAVEGFGAWEIERFGYAFDDCAAVAA